MTIKDWWDQALGTFKADEPFRDLSDFQGKRFDVDISIFTIDVSSSVAPLCKLIPLLLCHLLLYACPACGFMDKLPQNPGSRQLPLVTTSPLHLLQLLWSFSSYP